MASRAAKGLRLLQRGGFLDAAPAATRHAVRGVANAAVAPAPAVPCLTCERELLELRKELMGVQKEMRGGDQRLWLLYEGLLDVNHKMIVKMASMEAESIKRQAVAVESMVKTSYRILGSGGMFVFGMFTIMSPLLKSAWQNDTIDEVERRREIREAAAAQGLADGNGPNGEQATGVEEAATEMTGLDSTGVKGTVSTSAGTTHKTSGSLVKGKDLNAEKGTEPSAAPVEKGGSVQVKGAKGTEPSAAPVEKGPKK